MSYVLLVLSLALLAASVFNLKISVIGIKPVTPLDKAVVRLVVMASIATLFIGAAVCRYFGW